MAHADPYSSSRIGRGIGHLLGGKAITSLAGIGTFMLLVRELPIEQFAVYSTLFALVELIDAITGLGLNQILSRYVPELYVQNRAGALRRLLLIGVVARVAILSLILGILFLSVPTLAPLVGLAGWETAARAYLGVVLLRVAANTLFSILESMLRQGVAQIGFGTVTASRFVLIAIAAAHSGLDLSTVILIELLTEMIGCSVMLIGLMRATSALSPSRGAEDDEWIRANAGRMAGFGANGYLQHMLIMPFGGSTNRLLVGGSLGGAEVALFGFAQSIADLMQRYLPVKLLAGVIRPVLTARFVRDARFSDLELAANVIFKINAFVICLAMVLVVAGGKNMIEWASGGKYGEGGVGLLVAMCALILMYSLRHMLDHVSHAVERNGPLVWSNAVITLSVVPGIALLPLMGVYALPASNVVGLLIGCWVLVWRLRVEGFHYRQETAHLLRLGAVTLAAAAAAAALQRAGVAWFISAPVSAALFIAGAATLKPWSPSEWALIRQLWVRFRQRNSASPQNEAI